MGSKELDELARRAEELTDDEQLDLIVHLARKMQEAHQTSKPRRQWSEICGSAPYPLMGEDAQTWVSRTRCVGDEQHDLDTLNAKIGRTNS